MSATGDRDQMLADFQACTGIDDVGEALEYLQQADWDLMQAINRVLPPDSQALPSERSAVEVIPAFHPPTARPIVMDIDPPEPKAESSRIRRVHNTVSVPTVDLTKSMTEDDPSSDVEDLTESFQDEDYFDHEVHEISPPSRDQGKHLIDDNIMGELLGTTQFAENFAKRYGNCHPMFFQGTLEDAFKEATNKPAKDRKLLAIYLHHDKSVFAHVFCSQLLCSESIVSYLSNNFIVWGWDMTHDSNAQMLLSSVQHTFGNEAVGIIKSLETEKYPVIATVSRNREFSTIQTNLTSQDELLVELLHIADNYKLTQDQEIREEREREEREMVKREQDMAYQESLIADRAKDEAKKEQERQKQQEEEEQMQVLAIAEAERDRIARSLPPEPSADCQEPVCSLKCRMPAGKIVSRKFLRSQPLKILFDYLFSEGYAKDTYKFLTTYPKRDLTAMDETTLMENIFSVQDTLIVEER